jgi:hypothetical protein
MIMQDNSKKLMCTIVLPDGDEYWKDEVGGYHSPPIGWNPLGRSCGECCSISCIDCPAKDLHEGEYL